MRKITFQLNATKSIACLTSVSSLFSIRVMHNSKWNLEPHNCSGFLKYEVVDHVHQGHLVHHTEYFYIRTPSRYALCNITAKIEEALKRSEIKDGFCFVSAMHITAGVYVNDAESGLLHDISKWIEHLAPIRSDYHHHATGEDNADAHLKSFLTNHSLTAPITKGRLDFGTWQQIFYAEFDGERQKRVLVKISGIKHSS